MTRPTISARLYDGGKGWKRWLKIAVVVGVLVGIGYALAACEKTQNPQIVPCGAAMFCVPV